MIIGISGKKQSGKDTIARIIQYLTAKDKSAVAYDRLLEGRFLTGWIMPTYENKKFADVLKDITCRILNCTREDLENEDFKNMYLGSNWDLYKLKINNVTGVKINRLFATEKEAKYYNKHELFYTPSSVQIIKVKQTVRDVLQKIGTECGRNVLHPNVWINTSLQDLEKNVIFSDVRFLNEVKAISDFKDSFTIRVERFNYDSAEDFVITHPDQSIVDEGLKILKENSQHTFFKLDYLARKNGYLPINEQHISETELDDYENFDYTIYNTNSIKDLITQIKEILINEGILSI
jgi:hypothetical protein